MANVKQAFDNFVRDLELTTVEQDRAATLQVDLRERLRDTLAGVERDVLVGSYARRTAIRPLNDIDVFVVLDAATWWQRRHAHPLLLLEDVQRALRACYPGNPPATKIQGRSVNIEFSGTGIGYDIIPAFLVSRDGWTGQEVYEIPDRNQQRWIRTNPELHRQRCVAANEQAGGMLNRLIKAAKYWNRAQERSGAGKLLRSFHLEVMTYSAFDSKPADERRGLRDLFGWLQRRVQSSCPDPADLGPALDGELSWSDRQQAARLLGQAADAASGAIEHEVAGYGGEACRVWRALLGPAFPG